MAGLREYKGIEAVPYPAHLPPPGTVMTIEQFSKLDGEGWRLELVEGELEVMAPARYPHGEIAMLLGYYLIDWIKKGGGHGSVYGTDAGVQLSIDTLRAPDVMWVSGETRDKLKAQKDPKWLPVAPELAVEVLSPSDSHSQIAAKVKDFLKHGCKAVWVIDPRRKRAEMYKPSEDKVIVSETEELKDDDLLPGFRLRLDNLLQDV